MKNNFFIEIMFKMMMKKKFGTILEQAYSNLNNYCKSLMEQGKEHPYWVVLEERQVVEAA
jgi:hypothetical protein